LFKPACKEEWECTGKKKRYRRRKFEKNQDVRRVKVKSKEKVSDSAGVCGTEKKLIKTPMRGKRGESKRIIL